MAKQTPKTPLGGAPPTAKKPRAAATPEAASPTAVSTGSNPDPVAANAKITQARTLLAQILAMIKTLLRGSLTAKESRALVKARLAGQNLVPVLVGLLSKKPNLAPNGNSAQSIQAKYSILQAFLIFAGELQRAANDVEDTLRPMQAEMYRLSLEGTVTMIAA